MAARTSFDGPRVKNITYPVGPKSAEEIFGVNLTTDLRPVYCLGHQRLSKFSSLLDQRMP